MAGNDILYFLHGLRTESGGYSERGGAEHSIRSTLSVVKALAELGTSQPMPHVVDFVCACRDSGGGFAICPGGKPSAFDTADSLILLRNLGEDTLLREYAPTALAYMARCAETQFDHFMLVAAYEECAIDAPVPQRTVDFFAQRLPTCITERRVADTAIAAAALLRAGVPCNRTDEVAALLLGAQCADGGFGELGGTATLFATYCAMRTLVLLGHLPDMTRLLDYLDALATPMGYADTVGGTTTAGGTYMNLSLRTWLQQLQRIPVSWARTGDTDALARWLDSGGLHDLRDVDGYTPLLAAAAYGNADAVSLLLTRGANPEIKYKKADMLPVHMAAQCGDLDTVRLLLDARPSHINAVCAINGHTPLLQAAFFGKTKHLTLARYLLDHAQTYGTTAADLLAATNVRGYNALTMQQLWHNDAMVKLLSQYDPADGDERSRGYHDQLTLSMMDARGLTDALCAAITHYIDRADDAALQCVKRILVLPHCNVNARGGMLMQTPLIHAITGTDDSDPERGKRRYAVAELLLQNGADPSVTEIHPMGVGAVIRASVLNNFAILQLIAQYMTETDFARELNVSPPINGLTAMHDAIHRALTSPPELLDGHIEQIKWMLSRGARIDIPDNTGQTQRQLAQSAYVDAAFPQCNARAVWDAIAI